MSAPKKSIRDFFSHVPSAARAPAKPAPLQRASPEASSAQTSRPTNRDTPKALSDQSPLPSNAHVSPFAPSPPVAHTAPNTATSIQAQPPNPSQNSAASGASRRVVSNGEQVVLDSDSDSDSLPDLDWGQPKTSYKTAASATRLKRTSENENDALRKPDKKGKTNNWSFNKLVQSAHQNMETERKIKEHKADLNKSLEEPTRSNVIINKDLLGQVVQDDGDDPEKAHRLLLAIQRTNATQMETVFYFFGDTSDSIRVQPKFPLRCLPNHRWASNFADSYARDQAFLTGFAYQIFRLQPLPEELASWMLDQVCLGQSEALNTKYLDIVELHHGYIYTLIDKDRLNTLFRAIGGNVEILRSEDQVSPWSEAQSVERPVLPSSLESIVKLLYRTTTWLHMETRCHALYILCLICLDDRVLADANVLKTIHDTMEALIYNICDSEITIRDTEAPTVSQQQPQVLINSQLRDMISKLTSRITHPVLQRNLVYALPAKTLLSAYFQRHLALCFLLHPEEVHVSIADPKIPLLIHRHLDRSPNFRVNRATNYSHLAACLTLLDIAIGPGLLSVPRIPSIEPITSKASPFPAVAPLPSSSEIKSFNREVDALAQHVKILGNSIVEAGAAVEFTILNAKDNIERLCSRLEHAVRIGGKKYHDIFGNGEEEKQSKVSHFFQPRKISNPAATNCGIFGEEQASETNIQKTSKI